MQVQIETNGKWEIGVDVKNIYQRRRIHRFPSEKASKVKVRITATNGDASARIYEVRAYNE